MNRWSWRQTSVVLIALLWSGATQADALPAKVKRPFLWKIESARGTVYLFGSLHAARADMYPLDPRVYQAFDASDKLVLEADISGDKMLGMAGLMLAKAMYPAGDSLEKHIPKKLCDEVTAKFDKLGMPATQFKPWFLAMMLEALELEESGLGVQNGMELHFIARAQGRKPILELEGAAAQINLLDSFTDKEQEVFLARTLESLHHLGEELNQMLQAWNTGDDQALAQFLQQSDTPDFASVNKKLFTDRNVKMAAKIEGYLQSGGKYFVVVGAGHLVGHDGLLHLLAQKYKVSHM